MIQPYDLPNRDLLTEIFLPEWHADRERLSDERYRDIVELMLGRENPSMRLGTKWDKTPQEDPSGYLSYKEDDFKGKNNRYRRIFDLCRVLGITHIYDIGCEAINQSFQLVHHTRMTYTGIDTYFALNDWRESDRAKVYCRHPYVEEAPPVFCDGRIRFVKGLYPQVELDIQPNNIAVASCSLTMCEGKECISETAAALMRDFERILFNPPRAEFRAEDHSYWIDADWTGFEMLSFKASGDFLFATRHPEDVRRIKEMYSCNERGEFDTGISVFG